MLVTIDRRHNINTHVSIIFSTGMLLRHLYSLGIARWIVNFALKEGSSKQGNACLACTAWNWVAAKYLEKN